MAFSRYTRDDLDATGRGLRPTASISAVRQGLATGTISIGQRIITTQNDRLDNLAGEYYGDARYWWVLAAASNIGWSIQVPPGTIITIPDLKSIERVLG